MAYWRCISKIPYLIYCAVLTKRDIMWSIIALRVNIAIQPPHLSIICHCAYSSHCAKCHAASLLSQRCNQMILILVTVIWACCLGYRVSQAILFHALLNREVSMWMWKDSKTQLWRPAGLNICWSHLSNQIFSHIRPCPTLVPKVRTTS